MKRKDAVDTGIDLLNLYKARVGEEDLGLIHRSPMPQREAGMTANK